MMKQIKLMNKKKIKIDDLKDKIFELKKRTIPVDLFEIQLYNLELSYKNDKISWEKYIHEQHNNNKMI